MNPKNVSSKLYFLLKCSALLTALTIFMADDSLAAQTPQATVSQPPINGAKNSPAAQLQKTTYRGFVAYRLSDDKTEAIVVPSLGGRLMSYGRVGGVNWLWNGDLNKKQGSGTDYAAWGGDKTMIGPQALWGVYGAGLWPPMPTWNGPHGAQMLPGPKLKTWSLALWQGFGVRVSREYSYNTRGELVIAQTLSNINGPTLPLTVWNIAQIATPQNSNFAAFLPLNPSSPYKSGYFVFDRYNMDGNDISQPLPNLLRVRRQVGLAFKIGADSPVAAIGALRDNDFFLQRAVKETNAAYPEGGVGSGFSITLWHNGDAGDAGHIELEMMSPLRKLALGQSMSHTLFWSVRRLKTDPREVETLREINDIFQSSASVADSM